MTDRKTELEGLLAGATEGPWRFDHDWARIPTIHAPDGVEIANVLKLGFPHRDNRTTEQEANAALIVWLRNNAQHYLSLMGEVEMLKRQSDAECFALGEEIERLREALSFVSSKTVNELLAVKRGSVALGETK